MAIVVGGALQLEAPLLPHEVRVGVEVDLAESLNATVAAEYEEEGGGDAEAFKSTTPRARVAWSESGQVLALGRMWWSYAVIGSLIAALWPMVHEAKHLFGDGGGKVAWVHASVRPHPDHSVQQLASNHASHGAN